MNIYFQTINAFVEDTCVIIVVAYLLARGHMLTLMFQSGLSRQQTLSLGLTLGLAGLTEAVFPGARYPYVTSTLIVTFASVSSGLWAGLATAGVVAIGAILLQPMHPDIVGGGTAAPVLLSALLGAELRRALGPITPIRGMIIGICIQSVVVAYRFLLAEITHNSYAIRHSLFSIPANGFGLMILLIVVRDAQVRNESARHRAEAEHAQSLVAEAKLSALRARIHPHFLFNALTSIAALCSIAPDQAEMAIILLSRQMRRVLAADPNTPLRLDEEMEQVKDYLQIEQLRLGDRLRVLWEIDAECMHIFVPAFALQTLVENAVSHGIAPKIGPGTLRIVARRRARYSVIAVMDSGVGLPARVRSAGNDARREHGLQILTQHLVLLYGGRAKLRLLSCIDQGTIATFAIPTDQDRELKSIRRGDR